MRHLKPFIAGLLAVFLAVGLLSGCQSTREESTSPESESLFVDDPFGTSDGTNQNILGALGHGPTGLTLNEDGTRAPYEYNGGQCVLDYQVTASDTAKNVGFLLFLNGLPQPYRVDGEGDVEYMHMFELEEDDQQYPFTFCFTPVTGAEGDILELKIYSVYYPQFQPDMVTSSSYGLYYNILESTVKIAFLTDSDVSGANANAQTVAALSSVVVVSEDMTSEFVNSRLRGGFTVEGQSAEDLLEDSIYSFVEYNGETVYDNLDVSNQETVHITWQMVGVPGAAYRISLFANNTPMTSDESISWEVTLSKGKVVTLEADVDVSVLGDLTTFYIMACPIDNGSIKSLGIMDGPILFYKKES